MPWHVNASPELQERSERINFSNYEQFSWTFQFDIYYGFWPSISISIGFQGEKRMFSQLFSKIAEKVRDDNFYELAEEVN